MVVLALECGKPMDMPLNLTPARDDGMAVDLQAPTAERPLTLLKLRLMCELRALEREGAGGLAMLRHLLASPLRGRTAVVSAFGAESALLLALVAEIDRAVPVIFLETGKHFPETLAHRDRVTAHLGLTDVRSVHPQDAQLTARDPDGELWQYDTDACCTLRKVEPLEQALSGIEVWISGRKRFQAATRSDLRFTEEEGERLKLNPLADWDAGRILAELEARGLPRHPLVDRGYPSIGCAVCTRSVRPGEDSRAGRWSGSGKTECGIHRPGDAA